MDRQLGARAAERSGSRKRTRSTSPSSQFKRPDDKRQARSRNKKHSSINRGNVSLSVDQSKITSFRNKDKSSTDQQTNMAENQGEKINLEQQILAPILERLNLLETRMDESNKRLDNKIDKISQKLDERMDRMEGRIFEVEKSHDEMKVELENVKQKHSLEEDILLDNENTAKTSLHKSEANEQYLRNFNLRIFNLEESETETLAECETKVLALFREKLGVEVPIEAIDIIHRLGPKKQRAQPGKNNDENVIENHDSPTSNQNKTADKTNETKDVTQPELSNGSQTYAGAAATSESSNNLIENGSKERKTKDLRPERPVIVSFLSRRLRREVYSRRFELKPKTKNERAIIIVEDLSKQNHNLLVKAKDSKKYEKVWSKDGVIFGRQVLNKAVVPLKSMSDISGPAVLTYTQQRPRGYNTPWRGQRFPRSRGQGGRGRASSHSYGNDVSSYNPYQYFQAEDWKDPDEPTEEEMKSTSSKE